MNENRQQHSIFGHLALRSIAFKDPLNFLSLMAHDSCKDFMVKVWNEIGENLPAHSRVAANDTDFDVMLGRTHQSPTVLITLPKTKKSGEVIMVAFTVSFDEDIEEIRPENLTCRYFTLEHGFTVEGQSRTVFCEWAATDDPEEFNHLNYGDGPEPNSVAFAQYLETHVT